MDMKQLIINSLLILASVALFSCQRVEVDMTNNLNGGNLGIIANIPSYQVETRGAVSSTDTIFAYPFSDTPTSIGKLPPSRIVGDNIFYNIPPETQKIAFINSSDSKGDIIVSQNLPTSVIEVSSKGDFGPKKDILIGKVNSYSPSNDVKTVNFDRAVSKLKVDFSFKIGEDLYTNQTSKFDSVEVIIEKLYSTVSVTPSLETQFSGDKAIKIKLDSLNKTFSADNIYSFPSIVGQGIVVKLNIKQKDGTHLSFKKIVDKELISNKYYTIKVELKQENALIGFTLSDVTITSSTHELGYIDDNFKILESSLNYLSFPKLKGTKRSVTVFSAIGSWIAIIPTELAGKFSIENQRTKDMITTGAISGLSKDELIITSLTDNTGSKNLVGKIEIRSEEANSFIDINQSNGTTQTITIHIGNTYTPSSYFPLMLSGSNINIQKPSGGNMYNSPEDMYYKHIEVSDTGKYIITGEVTYLSSCYARRVVFDNCQSLNSVHFNYLYPDERYQATSFDFSSAPNIKEIYIYKASILKTINLTGCGNLSTLQLTGCNSTLPLANINFTDCSSIESLYLDYLPNLSALNLNNKTKLKRIDLTMSNFPKLTTISLENCTSLYRCLFTSSSTTPIELTSINLSGCTALEDFYFWAQWKQIGSYVEKFTTLNLTNCNNLKKFTLCNTSALTSVNISSSLSTLTEAYLSYNKGLTKIDISNAPKLKNVSIYDDSVLEEIDLRNCTSLVDYNCGNISSLLRHYLTGCTALEKLEITSSPKLVILNITNCSALKRINIENTPINILNISTSPLLDTLKLGFCNNLAGLDFSGLNNLKYLSLNNCSEIPTLDLRASTNLNNVNIVQCTKLSSINAQGLNNLKNLSITYCNNIKDLDLSDVSSLPSFTLSAITNPTTLNMTGMSGLKKLSVNDCNFPYASLGSLVNGLTSLDSLVVKNFFPTTDVLAISDHPTIKSIYIEGSTISKLQTTNLPSLSSVSMVSNSSLTTFENTNSPLKSVNLLRNQYFKLGLIKLNAAATLESLTSSTNNAYSSEAYSLSLANYTKLHTLIIRSDSQYYFEKMQSLDISECTSLKTLSVYNSHSLTALNITNCSTLRKVDLTYTELSDAILNTTFTNLPSIPESEAGYALISTHNATGDATCNKSIARLKNWTFVNTIN